MKIYSFYMWPKTCDMWIYMWTKNLFSGSVQQYLCIFMIFKFPFFSFFFCWKNDLRARPAAVVNHFSSIRTTKKLACNSNSKYMQDFLVVNIHCWVCKQPRIQLFQLFLKYKADVLKSISKHKNWSYWKESCFEVFSCYGCGLEWSSYLFFHTHRPWYRWSTEKHKYSRGLHTMCVKWRHQKLNPALSPWQMNDYTLSAMGSPLQGLNYSLLFCLFSFLYAFPTNNNQMLNTASIDFITLSIIAEICLNHAQMSLNVCNVRNLKKIKVSF